MHFFHKIAIVFSSIIIMKGVIILITAFIGLLLTHGQATWQTGFMFEFFRDDTSLGKTYDTFLGWLFI
jgi:hypothetical protein